MKARDRSCPKRNPTANEMPGRSAEARHSAGPMRAQRHLYVSRANQGEEYPAFGGLRWRPRVMSRVVV
jgi:hypothetical protein